MNFQNLQQESSMLLMITEDNTEYGEENKNDSSVKCETEVIKSSPYD